MSKTNRKLIELKEKGSELAESLNDMTDYRNELIARFHNAYSIEERETLRKRINWYNDYIKSDTAIYNRVLNEIMQLTIENMKG